MRSIVPLWLTLLTVCLCTLAGALMLVVKYPWLGLPMVVLWAWVAFGLYAEEATGE